MRLVIIWRLSSKVSFNFNLVKYLNISNMFNFLNWVGLYAVCCYLYENLKSPFQLIYHNWIKAERKSLTQKFGNWAIITGSTDGIGKAYAFELARKGFNVILISRSEEKLKSVATEIENKFNVKTHIIQVDFSHGFEVYEHIFKELKEFPTIPGLLVNNVGMGHNPPGPIQSFPPKELSQLLAVNIEAVTQLSRHFIELWSQQCIKGCIVNISSGTEMQPQPYAAAYAASKAYVRSLTLALQKECKPLGITVQLVSPNFVITKINQYSKHIMAGNLLVPPADEYAKWTVGTLGKVDITSGYFWHGIECTLIKILPIFMRIELSQFIIEYLTDNIKINKKLQ